jgi:hypothetical protein
LTVKRALPIAAALLLTAAPLTAGAFDVLASRGDDARTGANLRETLLTIDNVRGPTFGRIAVHPLRLDDGELGGDIYAQPLIVTNVGIPNRGVHNLLIVATTNNLVAALDADSRGTDTGAVWRRDLGRPPTIEQVLSGLTGCGPPSYGGAVLDAGGINAALLLMLTVAELPPDTRDSLNAALAKPTPISCTNIRPGNPVGVMSTPVIDRRRGLLFVAARTRDRNGDIHHNLHALDLRTGADHAGSPIEMRGTVSGIRFTPENQNQRVGLALADGHVIVAFGAHEDKKEYHGWVMSFRFDEGIGFQQTGIFVTTPSQYPQFPSLPCNWLRNSCPHGGIWQTGRAPAVDADQRVLLFVGNGKNDLLSDANNRNFGNSFVALNPRTLDVIDFFTPANHTIPLNVPIPADWIAGQPPPLRNAILDAQRLISDHYGTGINELDLDLGGSGPMIIPDSPFVIGGGKQGVMHVWRLNSLGGFSSNDVGVVQRFPGGDPERQPQDLAGEDSLLMPWFDVRSGHIMGGPVFWPRPQEAGGARMFNWSEDSELRSYEVRPLREVPIDATPLAKSEFVQKGHPGGILTLSANGATPGSGIVWAATYDAKDGDALKQVRPGILRAYDADTLVLRWKSSDHADDDLGDFAKFVPPTVANGRVYMATFSNDVKVYGLRHHNYPRPAAEVFIRAVQPLLIDPVDD